MSIERKLYDEDENGNATIFWEGETIKLPSNMICVNKFITKGLYSLDCKSFISPFGDDNLHDSWLVIFVTSNKSELKKLMKAYYSFHKK